jgi:iron complex outermembrane recepter protein
MAATTQGARRWVLFTSAALMIFGPHSAAAQQIDATPQGIGTASTPIGLDEIVVTAQRRSEAIQDVPVAITAVTSGRLTAAGVSGLDQLQVLAPSLFFTRNESIATSSLSIRGIGTYAVGSSTEPSVAIVADDVVLSNTGIGLSDLLDVRQIEVLRGPQGTLFGKNATSGVVNISSNKPTFDFEGSADVNYGWSVDDVALTGVISGPVVSNNVAARVAVRYRDLGGTLTNPISNQRLNGREELSIKGQVLFEPNASFNLRLIGDYIDGDATCCDATIRSYGSQVGQNPTLPGLPPQSAVFGPFLTPGEDNRITISGAPTFQNYQSWGLSAQLNYDFGIGTLTSVTAYRRFEQENATDLDRSPINLIDAAGTSQQRDQFSQELRFASKLEGKTQFLLGAFYYLVDNQGASTIEGALGSPVIFSVEARNTLRNENYAVFGDVTHEFSDQWRVSVGGRVLRETLDGSLERIRGPIPFPAALGPLAIALPRSEASNGDTNWMGRATLQFRPNADIMGYASVARGYKGAAIDQGPTSLETAVTFPRSVLAPEKSLAYELGVKSTLADRRLIANIALFWTDFDDLQAVGFDPVAGFGRVRNVGSVRSRGVEMDVAWRPVQTLTFTAAASYTDATYRNYLGDCYLGQTAAIGCIGNVQDLAGVRLSNAPTLVFSGSADITQPVSSSVALRGHLDVAYRGRANLSLTNDPNQVQRAYTLVNGEVGIDLDDGRFGIAVFGRNLTNRGYATRIVAQVIWAGYSQNVGDPRTLGVRAFARF